MKEPFDYDEFGAQIAFERDYGKQEEEVSSVDSGTKANLQDSLQFLLEINANIELFQENKISKEELFEYILNRKKEWGYISDTKFISRLMKQVTTL